MQIKYFIPLFGLLIASGCSSSVETNVIPLSATEIQVVVNAHVRCSVINVQEIAFRRAAVATIQRNFDRFVVTSVERERQRSGIYTLKHGNIMTIRMMTHQYPGAEGALDARVVLGSDWESVVASGYPDTC